MKKILFATSITLFILVLFAGLLGFYSFRDRHPGYNLDLRLISSGKDISAGFAKVDISPKFFETWVDANGDSRYDANDGDTFVDTNGNGKFDAIWLAGFHNSRPAQGILDPLWARSLVLDGGEVKVAICVIDMIGFGNDEVIATRNLILESIPSLDYVIISSTHTHSSPDLMGMWGPSEFRRGVNDAYLEFVKEGIKESVKQAYDNRRPAEFKFAEEMDKLKPLVGDTREPLVLDATLRLMHVLDAGTGETLGTVMNWGNHPETLWSDNIQVSSDFAGPWRDQVESGIYAGDSLLMEGLGGVAIFLNGAVGGLMTTHPSMEIMDPYTGENYLRQGPVKVHAQGTALAKITLETLNPDRIQMETGVALSVRAKTIALRMDNNLFLLAAYLGIFDRGFTSWRHIRSEVAAVRLGPASFVFVPGELYPEILHGGVESPSGADFGISPIEVPSLHSQMPGKFRFFAGMSNDMIGYIVPKSQWDEKPPFTYGYEKRPYGEINSLGPETGPKIHQELMRILKELSDESQ